MKCEYCGYDWKPRTDKPKSCPRCKKRFDYPAKGDAVAKNDELLLKARGMPKGFEKTLYVMSVITGELEQYGVRPVIIGGSAVEFYTKDWYATGDVDLAVGPGKREEIDKVLSKFGFVKETVRMWRNKELDIYLEFPGSIGTLDKSKILKVLTDADTAYVIGIEDLVFDRIEAAKHWDSTGDEEQAIRLGALYFKDIDWDYIEKKCIEDKSDDKLREIKKRIEDERSKIGRLEEKKGGTARTNQDP